MTFCQCLLHNVSGLKTGYSQKLGLGRSRGGYPLELVALLWNLLNNAVRGYKIKARNETS